VACTHPQMNKHCNVQGLSNKVKFGCSV